MLLCGILIPHEFREGNENLCRRNINFANKKDRMNVIIEILDKIAEEKLKAAVFENSKKTVKETFDGIPLNF